MINAQRDKDNNTEKSTIMTATINMRENVREP